MFDDDDFPFRAMGAMSQMHRSMMQDMDQMMSSMMGGRGGPFGSPFGGFPGFGGPFGAAITDGSGQRPTQRRQQIEMDPFAGFGGLLGGGTLQTLMPPHGFLNTPPMSNGGMFVSTSITTIGPDGPRVEQSSMHKTGGVTETKKRVDHNGESTMTIGHQIGDRTHVIEKKRDKDGNVRKNQKFVNLDEASAEDFDREFAHRVRSNYGYGSGGSRRNNAQAIEEDRTSSRRNLHHNHNHSRHGASSSSRNAPIITLPDEEEAGSSSSSGHANRAGPIIREISEEEAEQSIPKRRRGHFGAFRAE